MVKWLLPLAVVPLTAAGPAPQTFDARTVRGADSDAPAELYPARGPGPSPAMVLLHPCTGVGPHSRTWARRLAGWGYVTLLVDSFRSRGVQNVCNQGMAVPPEVRLLMPLRRPNICDRSPPSAPIRSA